MSPRPQLSMLLCMPFYLLTAIWGRSTPQATFGQKVTASTMLTGIWISLLMLPGSLFIRYVGANFGLMALVLMNVYSHVESSKELFGEDVGGSHFLYDVVVSAGSVSAMLLAAFIPQYVSHLYAPYIIVHAEVGLCNIAVLVLLSNTFVTISCNKVLMSLPKASENYFTKIKLSESHVVIVYYMALVVFLFMLIQDKEFMSTIRILLAPL